MSTDTLTVLTSVSGKHATKRASPSRKMVRWEARRSRYDTAIPMQDRWLFPGNKRGRPMTTRELSRLFHDARPIIFYNRASLERTRL